MVPPTTNSPFALPRVGCSNFDGFARSSTVDRAADCIERTGRALHGEDEPHWLELESVAELRNALKDARRRIVELEAGVDAVNVENDRFRAELIACRRLSGSA